METITERPAPAVVTVRRQAPWTGPTRAAARPAARGYAPPGAPTRGVRVLLAAFCCLTAAAVVSLVVLADRTAETFAWTIEPAVSAGFLGSGYAAGFVLSVLAVRSRDWQVIRVPFVTIAVFAWITTGATFYHLHRLHLQAPGTGPLAEPAAWLWLAVYVVVPVAMTVLLPRQRRVGVRRGPPAVPLPRSLTMAVVVEGVVLAAAGVDLLVRCLSSHGTPGGHAGAGHAAMGHPAAAATVEPLWPWTLTPLACGVIAAWLLAFAVAAVLCVADGDLARLRIATCAYTAFGVFQLLNVLRFRDDVVWSAPAAWVFVLTALAVTATGAAGWLLARGTVAPHRSPGHLGPR